QAELGLARSERRFHALLEQCPVGVAQNSLEGQFEYANAGFCSIVGYSPEELYRTTWQQITHPEDIGADLTHAERVLSGQLPYSIVEKRYIRKEDRKSTRLNSSHVKISYAVFCLKKKKQSSSARC